MLPLRVAVVPIVDVAPIIYAASCGHYAAHGLEVAIETAASGPAAAQLVGAGEADMGITAWHPLAGMWANGAPFSVVIDGAVLAAAQGKVMVSADSDIETLADLAGSTVGVGAMGSVFHVALLAAFQDAGMDASTVEIVAVPVTEQIAAVESGSIDAMLSLEPFTTLGQMQGLKVIADDMFGGRVEQGTSGGLMAMAPWAEQNEETIRRARAAWSQVAELMNTDEAGFRAFLPTYTALTPELAAVIALTEYRTTTEVANIQPSVDLAAEVGLIAETFDVEPFVAYPEDPDAECPLGRSTEVADDVLPLRVAVVPIVDVAPIIYAASCGHYAAHGLEVAIETAASGPAAAQLVGAGEADMGITAWHPLAGMWANGAPFSVVIDGAVLAAAQGKVMVSADSDIETLADLAGSTVGVGAMGSVFHVALLAAFQDAGMDASTVEIVAVPVTEQIAAVESGSIDAMLSLEPFTTLGQMQGLKVIADDMFGGRVEQGTSGGLMAMAPWAEQNEETIRRARAAWSQVAELMNTDEAGFRAFLPTYTALTPELAAVIALTEYRTTTEVANIQPSVDLAAEVGLIAETFDVEPFVAFPES